MVDAEKKEQFADLARQHKQSMGWVLNDCIDRMLAANSIDIYSNSVGSINNVPKLDRTEISALNIEEILKTYVSNYLDKTLTGINREDVESMIKSSIDNQLISSNRDYVEELIKSSIDSLGISSTSTNDIEELTRASIEIALEPIKESVSKLEAEVRAISDRAVVPTTDSLAKPLQGKIAKSPTLPPQEKPDVDGNTKTWGEFFKMVGIDAMTAVEAQSKQDTETRTKQIEIGLQAAKDQGLGEWAVKRAGRDFMRV
jgi:LPS O-antigen subunit length determinant protein (WzzB/FepE family)